MKPWAKKLMWWGLRGTAKLTAGAIVLAALGIAGLYWWERTQAEELNDELAHLEDYTPPTTVEVYDVDDQVFDSFAIERRIWVDLPSISKWMPAAVVAAEDRRFYEHTGVDLFGIFRAALANYREGSIKEGGSTLTQQLVKNLVVGSERSYQRKLREALLARQLERRMDKDAIMELYLNYAYFGSGNYGVQAAAQDYFGVSVGELDPGQAALLAGLIPAPSRYSPRRNPALAAQRRADVLGGMVKMGVLSPDDADAFNTAPIDPPRRSGRSTTETGAAFRTAVRREVRRLFTDQTAYELGLKVHTLYDPTIQVVVEEAIQEAVLAVEKRQGLEVRAGRVRGRNAFRKFLATGRGLELDEDGNPLEPKPGQCFSAMVNQKGKKLYAGPHKVVLRNKHWWRKMRSRDPDFPSESVYKSVHWGDLLKVCMAEDGLVDLAPRSWVQGAAVLLENHSGAVVAMGGGTRMALEGFNFATQARRQPGSSFKPYVYGAALAQGLTQIDEVFDGPIHFGHGKDSWSPHNYGHGYAGRLPMRFALARSLNTVAVRLALSAGAPAIQEFAAAAGVRTPIRDDLTIALGSSEVTVMDQVTGFATIARGGRHTEPVYLERVRDAHGRLLGVAGDGIDVGDRIVTLPGSNSSQAIPAHVAGQLVDMLGEVVRSGTGRRAFVREQDRGGKTGTTSNFVDAWFVGITPTHTLAVWVGSEGLTSLGKGETGSRAALPAWRKIMEAVGVTEGKERFEVDPSILRLPWGGTVVSLPRHAVPLDELPQMVHSDGPLPDFPGTGSGDFEPTFRSPKRKLALRTTDD